MNGEIYFYKGNCYVNQEVILLFAQVLLCTSMDTFLFIVEWKKVSTKPCSLFVSAKLSAKKLC
ncbi:hypothetical protein WQ57_08570 [Mesobacillus campisalis]|uniref:Uncharacterized protein n=1 Tax=Mesobacillus campisalis TaxID=1408103 RepID=A0A0M2SWT7_9BACI|nr:hypothetical protein WQ57_08570 [Mesobacillus campisalis]